MWWFYDGWVVLRILGWVSIVFVLCGVWVLGCVIFILVCLVMIVG